MIAGATQACFEQAAAFYRARFGVPIVRAPSLEAAELSKLLENAARHVQISLAHEFATLGATLGVEMPEVVALANTHTRVDIHQAGAGIGGHCLPYAARVVARLGEAGGGMPLLEASLAGESSRPARVVTALCQGGGVPQRVALWGLSYKPDVADTRNSPAAAWERAFLAAGVQEIRLHDPLARGAGVGWEESVNGVDLLVLTIAHRAWEEYDVGQIARAVRHKEVVDLCGALGNLDLWRSHGFRVRRLGVEV